MSKAAQALLFQWKELRKSYEQRIADCDKNIADLEKQLAEAEKLKPEERFVCPECGLDDFDEVNTECGHRVCTQCAVVCDGCGAIWCPDCTYPEGELKLCDACLSEREQAREAAEAA